MVSKDYFRLNSSLINLFVNLFKLFDASISLISFHIKFKKIISSFFETSHRTSLKLILFFKFYSTSSLNRRWPINLVLKQSSNHHIYTCPINQVNQSIVS